MQQVYQLGWASGTTALTGFNADFTADPAGTYTADITTTETESFSFSPEGGLGSGESRPDTAHTITADYAPESQWQMIDQIGAAAGAGG